MRDFYNQRNILIVIFLAALVLRIFAVFNIPARYITPSADAADYHNLAVNLLSGKGLIDPLTGRPSAVRPPLYPAYLAAIYLFFGKGNFLAVRIVQCFMSALLCVVVFFLGKVTFNRKTGMLAAAILVFYQPYIFYSFYGGPAFLLSENLFTFIFCLTALFMVRYFFPQGQTKDCVITGALLGVLVLIRPILALYPVFLLFVCAYKDKFLIICRKMAFLLAGFILVIAPWTIRNYCAFSAFVPFSTEGGYALFCGNNPYVRGGGLVRTDNIFTPEQEAKVNVLPEVKRDAYFSSLAKDFLLKNYKQAPKLALKKLLTLWDPFDTNYSNGAASRRYNFWYATVLMFAFFGIGKSLKSGFNIKIIFPVSLFVYFSVIAMIFAGDPRFRYVLEPYLIILASGSIFAIYDGSRRKLAAYTIIAAVVGLNLLLYINSDLLLGWVRMLL